MAGLTTKSTVNGCARLAARNWRTGGRRRLHVAAAADAAPAYDYDLFTIGAGSGGVRGSRFAASYGAKVAICELPYDLVSSETKGGVGGTCVLRGCVPKKLMVFASEYAEGMKDSVGFGWEERPLPSFDWSKFMEAKRKELLRLNGAYKNTLKNAKVEFIEGRGKIIDEHTVDVDGKRFTAKHILIATGSTATKLPIPGAEHTISSDEILELPKQPKKLTVFGAGYIAVEFAGVFKRFGAEVHVVYRADTPLRGFDNECRKFAAEQYTTHGLQLHPLHNPVEVKKQENGLYTAVLKGPDGQLVEIADNDYVLMATGRKPNTRGLGLEEVGVKTGKKGEIVVNEFSGTSVPSIWAIGDVTDRIQLTPVALMEGMALAKTLFLNENTAPDYLGVASAVFSHPFLASVGLSEEQAAEKYGDVDIYTSSFRPMRNTISGNPGRTLCKIVVEAAGQKVVGIHYVGEDAAEIMQGFAIAVKFGLTKQQLDSVVGIHPSAAEELVTMRSVTRKIRNKQAASL